MNEKEKILELQDSLAKCDEEVQRLVNVKISGFNDGYKQGQLDKAEEIIKELEGIMREYHAVEVWECDIIALRKKHLKQKGAGK